MNRPSVSNLAGYIEATSRPLDSVRRLIFSTIGAPLRPLLRSRELRVAVLGVCGVTVVWFGALFAPLWCLAIGPIVWGVPHLLADIRYLVVQQGLHRNLRLVAWAALPLAFAALGAGVLAGLVTCAAVIVAAEASRKRTIQASLALTAAFVVAWYMGPSRDLAFAHLHNLIAIGFWWLWRPRARRLHFIPLALVLIGSALIFGGAVDAFVWSFGAFNRSPNPQLGLGGFIGELSGGLPAPWSIRLVLSFAFLQSVHYLIWLRMIPDEAQRRETPRSYRHTMRTLVSEIGPICLVIIIAIALGIALWGAVDLTNARRGYLRLALFHGHLEMAAATWLWLQRDLR